MDSFYRLFHIPGMEHCEGGNGAWQFGQTAGASFDDSNPANNILLALVDWVENGVAPDTMTGFSPSNGATRVHCRYPMASTFNGSEFVCTTP